MGGWWGGFYSPVQEQMRIQNTEVEKGSKKTKDLSNKNIGNYLTCKYKYRRELNSVEISDPIAFLKKIKNNKITLEERKSQKHLKET